MRARVWSFIWLEQLMQDVRYGAENMLGDPGFTARFVVNTVRLVRPWDGTTRVNAPC
jgi:hypothetical protein